MTQNGSELLFWIGILGLEKGIAARPIYKVHVRLDRSVVCKFSGHASESAAKKFLYESMPSEAGKEFPDIFGCLL